MRILINGKVASIKENTSFEFVEENRLFSGSDGYSLTITFPLHGCSQNLAIFGNINRADVAASKAVFDCSIRDGSFVKHGSIVITEINETEVKTQFLEGRSETNFDSDLDKIYINELDLGAPEYLSASQISPSFAWDNGTRNLSCVALPWVNNESGNIQNCPKYENGKYVWHSDTRGLSWQPYLLFVVKRICEALDFTYDFSAWENREEHRYLLVCNTLPWAWNMPEFASALPHWSVKEFFEKLEVFLDAEFDFDMRGGHVAFCYSQDYVKALPVVALDRIVAEHSVAVTVENEKCEYREAKNLVYAECDHEMWKFYSCDWFIKARKRDAISYDTLSQLLAANRSLATWNGSSQRGSNRDKLLYAKDLDIYFVVRGVEKTLVQERKNMPNLYSYKCLLQPVNLFGGRIVDEREEADSEEVEFVPAWIDYTDGTYGKCLYLSFSGYDDGSAASETNVGGSSGDLIAEYKARVDGTFYQPISVQALAAGEKKQKSEFYDKIYIGWWDGAADYDGKLPCPFVDDVVINDDWSGYFRPHTSLRLNNTNANSRRSVYAINPKQKVTFKFLSDTLPNPRSVFLIHGKRYLCEKITATFTQNGMSQLIKGYFWSIIE